MVSLLALVLGAPACAWETGRVVEITFLSPVDRSAVKESLLAVAGEMGLVVEGPERGPGGIVEYRARHSGRTWQMDFFVSADVGDRPSVVIRTMNAQTVDPAMAERAFDLVRSEFARRGIKYEVRRN